MFISVSAAPISKSEFVHKELTKMLNAGEGRRNIIKWIEVIFTELFINLKQ
jgi:hypothetical protein